MQAARRSPDTYVVINAVDRALYHTGRLGRDMFLYPQHPDALLLTGQDRVLAYWHKFDTLIDLGLVNLAEKDLTECLETYGEHPLILERLALVNMVKGKTGAARIYLGALRKTLFHHKWASDYLARLDADPTLSNDPEIQRLRAQCLRKDSTAGFYVTEMLLSTLVEQGGGNRMAYEYLMSWYMLNGQLPRFVQNVTKLSEFGYTDVPPLYQEAAVIYAYGTRKPVPLVASPDAQRRIEHFSSIVNKYGRNRDAAFAELARDYAGSYLFYYFYNFARTQK
ncbi:MAG: hypothetical protein A2Y77_09215 [Planctomycetes bacterium RBG_13_62_9]|nr:MAG: hypothetical protein A2Y77_09215 [Planctomycetes bacterium RBG_13_62_9]